MPPRPQPSPGVLLHRRRPCRRLRAGRVRRMNAGAPPPYRISSMTAACRRRPLASPLVLSASLVAVVAFAACDVKVGDKGMSLDVARETLNKEWSRSYPLRAGRFELSLTGGGVIEVTGTDDSQVDV